ncbi:hypothetical protein EMCG_00740 [[Emmonsia] crescens]|uniref:Uncharacterized protein n=1 Tax=[Emmonsia] crescens TaxID=73230 RepID=A0A0G2IYC3_9EURO|nr:hypothetical protein EMCG_00740 [Emmonsia crescens UAMH 3008]
MTLSSTPHRALLSSQSPHAPRLEPDPAQQQGWREDEDEDRSLELSEGRYEPNHDIDDDDDGYTSQSPSSVLLPTNWSPSPCKSSRNKQNYYLHTSCLACFRSTAKPSRKGPTEGRRLVYCIAAVLAVLLVSPIFVLPL